ncbi:lysophospholipid acyltransferase 6 isoform X2 [Nematostella vectensis]|nr:lysophospholipid acyltransferase 6 isoform X2 [Nematostella vectensis]
MGILSAAHLYRQITDYGSYVLDYTGPLMIITQKIIYVAFSVHDGMGRDESNLNAEQKKEKLKKVPSPLEYFGYVFHYSNILIGPVGTYHEYTDFITGTVFNTKGDEPADPSPLKATVEKLSSAVLCVVVFVVASPRFPVASNADPYFIDNTPFIYRLIYAWLSIVATRMRYYFAFKAGEAINNICGLGFGGYDEEGNPSWNKMSNANITKLELAQNMKMLLDNWNISTAVWLRRIVYDRVTSHRTLATFLLSAFWHGFYGGYYLTFITCQILVEAARVARRTLREHFQGSKMTSRFYDVITCVVTMVFVTYATVPFVLLDPWKGLRFWRSLYFFGHIGSLLALLVLRGKPSRPQPKPTNQDANRNGILTSMTCAVKNLNPREGS